MNPLTKAPGHYFKDPLTLILAILVALSLLGTWQYAKGSAGIDYYVTWVASDAVKNDTPHNIYEPSSRYKLAVEYRNKADALADGPKQKQVAAYLKELQMTATPFLYWVTGLLASGDYEKDLARWQFLSLVLVVGFILLTSRLLGYSAATSLAILLPALVWFTPLYSSLNVANVNCFQLGLLGLILWVQRRQAQAPYLFAASLITGLLVMFKPNLAPVALLFGGGWAIRRQYMQLGISLGGMAAGAITAVLVSSIWLGNRSAWLDWLDYIRQFVDGGPGETGGNYAIITQISSDISPLGQLAAALSLCVLCLVFLWWGRKLVADAVTDETADNRLFMENTLLIAMGCIIALLTSSLVWLHYYLFTIPMILVALRPWQESAPMKVMPFLLLRVLPVAALVLLLDTALREFISGDDRTYRTMACTTATLALFVAGSWQLGHGIRDTRRR
jgi:hypothetical protein